MNDSPPIFAFYSFKGGVGRSMAVLNLAYALAIQGQNVLVLDMDLEAPGLSGFLHRKKEIKTFAPFDMVDLVRWAADVVTPLDPNELPPLEDFTVSIPAEKIKPDRYFFEPRGRLDIIPVDEGRDYYDRLTALEMGNLSQDDLVRTGSVLRVWLQRLRVPRDVPDYYAADHEQDAPYDIILIDSRTGITETGGLCIGPLSDILVVLTALNDQNVKGTRQFLEEVGIRETGKPASTRSSKPCLIVATLVPAGEIQKKRQRLKVLEEELGPIVVRLSYHPQLALEETIFTRDCPEEYLTREYVALLEQIVKSAHGEALEWGPWLADDELWPRYHEGTRALLNSTSLAEGRSLLEHLLRRRESSQISEDEDFALHDRAFRTLLTAEFQAQRWRWDVILRLANLLDRWQQCSTDPERRDRRRQAELQYLDFVIDSPHAPAGQKAKALINRGLARGEAGQTELAIADFTQVIEMDGAPLQRKAKALYNRGVAFGEARQTQQEVDDYSRVIAMDDASLDLKARALVNRGVTHDQEGETERAIADYSRVVAMEDAPLEQRFEARLNRGWAYYLTDRLNEAVDDERHAIQLNARIWNAHANLAIALLVLGKVDEALACYDQALALAKRDHLDEIAEELHDAAEKHGPLKGMEAVREKIENRRRQLQGESK